MNMVESRGDNEPLQHPASPRHIEMHPINVKIAEYYEHSIDPPRGRVQNRCRKHVWTQNKKLMRHGRAATGQPIHIIWRVVPLVSSPKRPGMHESMDPIVAEIGDQEINSDADEHWKLCYVLGKPRIGKEAVVHVHHQRDNKEHVKQLGRKIPCRHAPVRYRSRTPEAFNRYP